MTRLPLAAISAIFAFSVLSATGSVACVSCNYTPEVVNTPVNGAAGKKARAAKAKTRKAPAAAQKRIAKPHPSVEKPAKSETASKPVPTDQAADGDGSGVSTAALGDDEQKPAEQQQAKPSDSVGCKKFSPTAGTTIPVPCE
jgi:hypothetical protein